MKNEMIANLTGSIVDEIASGRITGHVSNGLQNVLNGKTMIEANKEVDLKRISAQEQVILSRMQEDNMKRHEKADLAKTALKTVETMSRNGDLTDTNMLAIFNFVIATNSDL